jgi:alpha-2-macroglobulin
VGVRYAPKDRQMPALNEGFTVERTYSAVDDEDDVRWTEEGWEIRAGARVKVELTMTIPARRYHVALVDWLPAGFEPINTALAISQVEEGLAGGSRSSRGRGRWWWWWGGRWFEHENLRDERVEAFSSLVYNGVHNYSYVARATTPGTFVAMPAKAEEMYHPETFGRSATEIVRVIDRR